MGVSGIARLGRKGFCVCQCRCVGDIFNLQVWNIPNRLIIIALSFLFLIDRGNKETEADGVETRNTWHIFLGYKEHLEHSRHRFVTWRKPSWHKHAPCREPASYQRLGHESFLHLCLFLATKSKFRSSVGLSLQLTWFFQTSCNANHPQKSGKLPAESSTGYNPWWIVSGSQQDRSGGQTKLREYKCPERTPSPWSNAFRSGSD